MGSSDLDREKAVKILNHPVRVKIIKAIGASGSLSWKELSGTIGTSTGSLYHHLDMLERIVARDSSKRYVLTKMGEDVYAYIKQNPTMNPDGIARVVQRRTALSVAASLVIPRTAVHFFTSSSARAWGSSAALALAAITSFGLSGFQPLLLSLSPSQSLLQTALGFAGSLAAVYVVSFLASVALKARANLQTLLLAVCASYLPLVIFALLYEWAGAGASAPVLSATAPLTFVFVAFQGWSMGVLGAGFSVATGMRMEKAMVFSLLLVYASVALIPLAGVKIV